MQGLDLSRSDLAQITALQDDPVTFIRCALGAEPDEWQQKAAWALAHPNCSRVAIKSCTGPGKTAFDAWIICWWLWTRPFARIGCTSTTQHQLYDLLWPEVHKWIRKSKWNLGQWLEWSARRISHKANPKEWFATAVVSKVEKVGKGMTMEDAFGLQGLHSPHMLFLIDEASGVQDAVYGAAEGAMATGRPKLLATGNPNVPEGWFFEIWHKHRTEWFTLTVSYKDSPRVRKEWAESMIRRYGLDHPWVQARVLAEFPSSSAFGLIPLWAWERGQNSRADLIAAHGEEPRTLGVDVAAGGSAASTIAFARGPVCEKLEVYPKMDTPKFALIVFQRALEWEAELTVVDCDGGYGKEVTHKLAELGLPGLLEWHGAASPTDSTRYLNARAELGWKLKTAAESQLVGFPDNEDACAQAVAMQYEILRNGLVKIQNKKEFARDHGGKSPDEFDAVGYSLMPWLIRTGTKAHGAFLPKAARCRVDQRWLVS